MSQHFEAFLDLVKSEVAKYALLKKLSNEFEEKTKVNFEYLVAGLVVLVVLLLFSGFGASLICHIAAFAYPFYATLVVLNATELGPSSQFWLVYWVIYGLLGVLETSLSFLVAWLPVYYPLKFTLVLWLYLPKFRGADFLYHRFLLPYFKKHESTIDEALRKIDKSIVLEKTE